MSAPRIALIHAMPMAIEPVTQVFHELWPSAAAGIPAVSGRRVLTSPHSAVARLKRLFADR
jgi:hypothetical protein